MRKDIRKRLEKAITALHEPGGSTIRSIVKVINQDSPALSLRKVLEALQEGINEGFLCMYNGRFKLRPQLNSHSDGRGNNNSVSYTRDRRKEKSRDSDLVDEDSDNDQDDWDEDDFEATPKADERNLESEKSRKSGKRLRTRSSSKERFLQDKKERFNVKTLTSRKMDKGKMKKKCRNTNNLGKVECSLLEISSSGIPEKKSRKQTTEKPDIKKQRGPRCTSMKKDVRMPSKVHIPFVPPSAPQRTNNFNDLLRRSPEPVNGPLFDSHIFFPENVGLFGTYC